MNGSKRTELVAENHLITLTWRWYHPHNDGMMDFLTPTDDHMKFAPAIAIFLVMALTAPIAQAQALLGQASVIDGDTIEIHGKRIRLHGVDAPESSQPCVRAGQAWRCGAAAANALDQWIARRTVSCQALDTDRYGRTIARCSVAGQDMGAWLVGSGWALAYRQYSKDYIPAETAARLSGRNIWSGQVQAPWDYRRK